MPRQNKLIQGILGTYFRTWNPEREQEAEHHLKVLIPEWATDRWDLSEEARASKWWLTDHNLSIKKIGKLAEIYKDRGWKHVEWTVFQERRPPCKATSMARLRGLVPKVR